MKAFENLNGFKVLSKEKQKLIVGAKLVCTRSNGKVLEYFEPIGTESAVAWVDAWNALGWDASCKGVGR